MHQQTHGAIARRAPALIASIHKFNAYINELAESYDPNWGIPLPSKLPTKLADLQDDPSLMEDVWLLPSTTPKPPPWLDDPSTRAGIRAMLKHDRCREEYRRVRNEAENLRCWYSRQMQAIELATRVTESECSPGLAICR